MIILQNVVVFCFDSFDDGMFNCSWIHVTFACVFALPASPHDLTVHMAIPRKYSRKLLVVPLEAETEAVKKVRG